jgi:alcohol dehydrogenase class IV
MPSRQDQRIMNSNSSPLSFQYLAAELRLFCGEDSLAALARELQRNGCKRAVVVCGRSVSTSNAMELLRNALGPVLVGESTAVRPNSPVPAVEEAARTLGELQADAVIAIGGGSAAVTARAASILLAEKRPAQELCTRRLPNGGFESPRLGAAKLSQFVVPTTPSTAFVKAGSAVHDPDTGNRLALFDPKTRAKALFLHPEFLRTAPSKLVQSASLNTLSTAVEALESPKCDPISEAMLMHSLRLIAQHLDRVSPEDIAARERLALAAVLCGRGTEQSGGGLASVLAHAIGHRSNVANGIINAIVLAHTMRFNAPVTLQGSARIAEGLRLGSANSGLQHIEVLESLLAKLPIPRRLRDIGVAQEDLAHIADAAMSDWFISRNPRRVSAAAEVLGILNSAW